jgi:hypothetical protein
MSTYAGARHSTSRDWVYEIVEMSESACKISIINRKKELQKLRGKIQKLERNKVCKRLMNPTGKSHDL